MTDPIRTQRPRPTAPPAALFAALLAFALAAPAAAQNDDQTGTGAPSIEQPAQQPTQQPAEQPAEQPAPQGQQARQSQRVELRDVLRQIDRSIPPVRLGLRADIVREAQVVHSRVVIVDSAEAAAEALRGWKGLRRFPVLIDDGTLLAAENIARFVRAFEPAKIVRWSPETEPEWPEALQDRASEIVTLIGETVDEDGGIDNVLALVRAMRDKGIGPQGVVALDLDDPAWVAGLALAVGRVQPVVFIEADGRVNREMTGDTMRELAQIIQSQLQQTGMAWSDLGDEIDAVTIAANLPLRVGLGVDGEDEKALTDLIGRHRAGIGNRWAWAGNVFGDSQTALYRAMCGLFLPGKKAWFFDGYGRGDPWDLYDATAASRFYEDTDIDAEVHDTPANSVRDWRGVAAPGIDTDLVFINSKGTVHFFQLGNGKAWVGDIPLLDSPAAVHIVHSWSARAPGTPRTVAGRWLEHGAYAYYGAIDEPYLNAFVRTPLVVNRLLAGMPFGVAVRVDEGPPWKLNVLGDPLVTFRAGATAGNRIDQPTGLAPVTALDESASAAIKDGRYAEGMRDLLLAGRDADVARLAAAMIAQKPDSFGNDAARASALSLYREAKFTAFGKAYNALAPDDQETLLLQDALWHAGRAVLRAGPDTVYEGLMRRNLRRWQTHHDAIELAEHIADRAGPDEAANFLKDASGRTQHNRHRQEMMNAARRYGG